MCGNDRRTSESLLRDTALPSRQLESCLVRPISDWALSQIFEEIDRQGTDAVYRLYQALEQNPAGASLNGKLFENKVHQFFQSITEPRRFTIFSLEDRSINFEVEFSAETRHEKFGAIQHFSGQLATAVNNGHSCYLRPISPVFPSFDSFLLEWQVRAARSMDQQLLVSGYQGI